MKLNKTIFLFQEKNNGQSFVELLVGIGITLIALSGLAFLSSYGKLSRGEMEKQNESYKITSNLISKLYNSSISEIEQICSELNALEKVATDPCEDSKGQLKNLTPKGPFTHPLSQYFDATINVTTLQNSDKTKSASISCIHIQSCRYILSNSLLQVDIVYHWFDARISRAQNRLLTFRRGVR